MAKKTGLTLISRKTLSVEELHIMARDAATAAAIREAETLERAIALIESVESTANHVILTVASDVTRTEVRAAAIALSGAATHLRAAITSLECAAR